MPNNHDSDASCYSRIHVEAAITNVLTGKVNKALSESGVSLSRRLDMAIIEAFTYNKGSFIDHNILRWAAVKLKQGDNLV